MLLLHTVFCVLYVPAAMSQQTPAAQQFATSAISHLPLDLLQTFF